MQEEIARRRLLALLGGCAALGNATGETPVVDARASSHPSADFSYSPSSPVPDEEVDLDGTLSDDPDGEITDYYWTVETSTGYPSYYYSAAPTHSWEEGGSYEVALEVTDDSGQTDTATKTVDVDNSTPTADFTVDPSSPAPDEEVELDGTESTDSDGEIADYYWTVETSTAYLSYYYSAAPTHSWEEGGSYDVTLEVTDNGEATDSVTKTVEVVNQPPTADFSHEPLVPRPDEEVTLDGSVSSDPDGEITDYYWEVETSTGRLSYYHSAAPTHSWEEDGSYEVTLEVTDNGEATSTVTETVHVGNSAPTARMSVTPADPEVGETVTFDASESSDPEDNIEGYSWVIGGVHRGGETVEHTFSERGERTVSLTVDDTRGATDTVERTLFPGNRSPSPSITYAPTDVTTETTVTFDASESTDPDGSVDTYRWTFSDGTTATGATVEHTFSEQGYRLVELAVTDDEGGTATETVSVEVNAPPTPTPTQSPTPTETPTESPTESGATAARTSTETPPGADGGAFETTVDPAAGVGPSPTGGTTRDPTGPASDRSIDGATATPTAAGADAGSGGDGADEDGSDGGLLPLIMGALGLGGIGASYYYWQAGGDEAGGPDAAELRAEADQRAAEAELAVREGDYEAAVAAYENAIGTYEAARDRAGTDSELGASIVGVIAETREQLDETRERLAELDAVREPLADAESTLQTAISEHVRNQLTPARRDYRQARDQYEQALAAVEDADGVFEDGGLTVAVGIEGDYIPEKLAGWPQLTEREREALSEAGVGTLTELVDAGEQRIADLEERDAIDGDLADRLRAAVWWHGNDERTFTGVRAIERQRDRARRGLEMLS